MDDDAKNRLKMILAAVAVVVAVGLAVMSGIRSQQPAPRVVGSLGANPLGSSPKAAKAPGDPGDPAMGGGKAESDKN